MGKELHQWSRDPMRSTTLLIAAIVGLGVCLMPFLTSGTRLLMPIAGLLTAVVAGAVAGNLIGADGLALKLSIMTPHAARPDGLGRQTAWLNRPGLLGGSGVPLLLRRLDFSSLVS